jgi:hypothetical protein
MTSNELEEWLQTDESKSVGQSDDGGESKGHESGRRIFEIRRKNESDYTDDDVEHMKRVNGYIKRHLGQRPNERPRGLQVALLTHELGSRPPEAVSAEPRSTKGRSLGGRGRARKDG